MQMRELTCCGGDQLIYRSMFWEYYSGLEYGTIDICKWCFPIPGVSYREAVRTLSKMAVKWNRARGIHEGIWLIRQSLSKLRPLRTRKEEQSVLLSVHMCVHNHVDGDTDGGRRFHRD